MKEFDNNENVSGNNTNDNDDDDVCEKERYTGKNWTKKEIAIVRKSIKQYGKNWEQRGSQALAIAALLNNRTAEDVMRFIQNNFAAVCREAQENRKRNGNEKLPSPKKIKSLHPSRIISNEKKDSVKQVQKKKNPDYRYYFGPNPGVQPLPPPPNNTVNFSIITSSKIIIIVTFINHTCTCIRTCTSTRSHTYIIINITNSKIKRHLSSPRQCRQQ